MPERAGVTPLPNGEAELRELASAFAFADGAVLALLAEAAAGQRAWATARALERIAELRTLDFKKPVITAYLFEHPKGRKTAVDDLAGSLALRLDRGAQRAMDSVRASFPLVDKNNVAQFVKEPLTAAIDTSGKRWALDSWAKMNTETIGRQATSRGLAHQVGKGGRVTINVGKWGWCKEHSGEAVIGQDPLPPYHPSCSCVATAT